MASKKDFAALLVAPLGWRASDATRQVCVPLSFLAVIIANVLSSLGAINGTTNADVSNKYPTLFTPDGWAFSIWGLIYLWNAFYCVYQGLPRLRSDPRERVLGWLFVAASLLNAAWSVIFPYEKLELAGVVITLILATLAAACSAVWFRVPREACDESVAYRAIVAANFSLYCGWLSVATIANWAIVGVSRGWHGEPWSEAGWSVLMMSVAAALSLAPALLFADGIFAVPICVGISAIASNNAGPDGDETVRKAAIALACVAAAAIAIGEGLRLRRRLASSPRAPLLPSWFTAAEAYSSLVVAN